MPAPSRMRLRVREIVDPRDPALGPAHRMLAAALPPGEVVTLHDWRATLAERQAGVWTDLGWHLLVAERGGWVLGMASGTYLGSLNLGMIGYLALAPLSRGQGVGTRLRGRLRRCFEQDARRVRGAPLVAIVGEVSAHNPWLRHVVTRERAIALDFPYHQPSLHPGDLPSPLVLYYQPLTRSRRSIPVPELRRLLYAIWRRLYRIPHPLTRPAFRAMLRALQRRRSVGNRLPPPTGKAGRGSGHG